MFYTSFKSDKDGLENSFIRTLIRVSLKRLQVTFTVVQARCHCNLNDMVISFERQHASFERSTTLEKVFIGVFPSDFVSMHSGKTVYEPVHFCTQVF